MKRIKSKVLVLAAVFLLPMAANADLITTVYGDKDCFGIASQGGSACGVGIDYVALGGVFFEDNRDPGDPSVTDIWHLGSQSFTITLAITAAIQSLELDLFHVGAGTVTPGSISVNGTAIGTFGSGNNLSTLTTYVIAPELFGLSGLIDITLSGSDGWSLDYAEVRATTVPEPGTLALLGIGLLGMGVARRRKKA